MSRVRAAGSTEWIIGVSVVLMATLAVATLFGRTVSRKFSSAAQGLDAGKPLTAAPAAELGSGEAGSDFSLGKATGTMHQANPFVGPTPDANKIENQEFWDPLGWEANKIIEAMSQFDQNNNPDDPNLTAYDGWRCAQASLLAALILEGPFAVNKMLKNLMDKAKNDPTFLPGYTAGPPPMVGEILVENYLTRLETLQHRLMAGTLDHGDLGQIQELLYQGFVNPNDTVTNQLGTTFPNIEKMMQLAGAKDVNGNPFQAPNPPANHPIPRAALDQAIAGLPLGGSMIVGIDTGQKTGADHAVLIGRDQDGNVFLYDPWPLKTGSGAKGQVFYQKDDPDLFERYLRDNKPIPGFQQFPPAKY